MLYSSKYKQTTERYKEDTKTSTIFGGLLLLPDNELRQVLSSACHGEQSPISSAGQLKEFHFWPKWYKTEGTSNDSFVEPDVFLRFELCDVIIEAKLGEQVGQYAGQWRNEAQAYHNLYGKEEKPLILIALGGNSSLETEEMEYQGGTAAVYKSSWHSLLVAVEENQRLHSYATIPNTDEDRAKKRLYQYIYLGFELHGIHSFYPLNRLKTIGINPKSRQQFKKLF